MANITRPGVTDKSEEYRGFIISWDEPPMWGRDQWTANVASESPHLLSLMRQNGAKVIEGRTRDEMLGKTKQYIDGLLG